MNNLNPQLSVESLYNISFDELCRSMSEELMVHVLNEYPPLLVLQVIWKILHVSDENQGFEKHTLSVESSVERGSKMFQMSFENINDLTLMLHGGFESKVFEDFAKTHEIKFVDKCNFCNHFDLKLFFKIVEITELRHQLFTIFQICVQVKGFEFPKQLAEEWIKSERLDVIYENIHFHYIEQGLKLGIFLGDTGWLHESALVLSHTYNIICKKWVCQDQNLKLIKIIQCLTKWLFVLSNYYNFEESKVVLQYMLNTINIFENMEGRTLCIANAYVSVSHYYVIFRDFKEAWTWAVKAVNELHDKSADILKLQVINHAIKVCSDLDKLSTAKKMIDQLKLYGREINQNIHVDMLMNEANYLLKADLGTDSFYNYHVALDSWRNLFGYYNLKTAVVFVDYAYTQYTCESEPTSIDTALCSILQGIFIMKKIGLPDDNMLLVDAGEVKALILEEKALDIMNEHFGDFVNDRGDRLRRRFHLKIKNEMLHSTEILHKKMMSKSIIYFGEKSLYTAKTYCSLGQLYLSNGKYKKSEKMHLKAIEICESIFGGNHPEVAHSLNRLANLYSFVLGKFHKAEELYLRSKNIYETTYGHHHTEILNSLYGLVQVYHRLNDLDKYYQFSRYLIRFWETREAWLHQVHTTVDGNCKEDNLNLEKFKCLVNDCL